MTENCAYHQTEEGINSTGSRYPFVQYPSLVADLSDLGYITIDELPDDLLLEIFDFCMCRVEAWEALVKVGIYRLCCIMSPGTASCLHD